MNKSPLNAAGSYSPSLNHRPLFEAIRGWPSVRNGVGGFILSNRVKKAARRSKMAAASHTFWLFLLISATSWPLETLGSLAAKRYSSTCETNPAELHLTKGDFLIKDFFDDSSCNFLPVYLDTFFSWWGGSFS